MKTKIKRAAAALTAAIILLSALPPAAFAASGTIYIKSAADLKTLAADCTEDSYSRSLTVKLEADIHLESESIGSIPIFCGVFDGQGHTISGFVINTKGSDIGFFRYIAEGASVKNLKLEGVVRPEGSAVGVGILAGENSGRIENCSVSGSAAGAKAVGGIAGRNGTAGEILSCENKGELRGASSVGGIAGENLGTIKNSRSDGIINSHNDENFTDCGGIAGKSSGWVESCINSGSVGYPHNGYNMGGIVGFQKGVIIDCENSGAVFGRKDVGGIVGQFEPNISMVYGDTMFEALESELGGLSAIMREFTSYLGGSMSGTASGLSRINDLMQELGDILTPALEEAAVSVEALIGDARAQTGIISGSIDELLRQLRDFSNSAHAEIGIITSELRAIRGYISAAIGSADAEAAAAAQIIDSELTALEADIAVFNEELQKAITAAEALDGFAAEAALILQDNSLSSIEKMTAIAAAYSAADVDLATPLGNALSAASGAAVHMAAILGELTRASDAITGIIGNAMPELNAAADRLNAAVGRLSAAANGFTNASSRELGAVNEALRKLGGIIDSYIKSSGDRYEIAAGEVSRKLDELHAAVNAVLGTVSDSGSSLTGLSNRLMNQIDAVGRVVLETGDPEYIIDDISAEEEAVTKGSVISCRNFGEVSGDINIGGIAGMVSYELLEDPEEDFSVPENLSADTTALIRATIRNSRNSGRISAKNDGAGGIAGRCDLGALLGCVNIGDISSENGSYVGGIVGHSRAVVSECRAQGVLSGEDYIGGIAGQAAEITGCLAMAELRSEGERLGAIAGVRPGGECSANFFLKEDLGGIDGISYEGVAEGLSFAEFSRLEGLPAEFLSFGVSFIADGKVIASFPLDYGEGFDTALAPDCPEKEGYSSRWAEFDSESVRRSLKIEALYIAKQKTISTGEERPLLLSEGSFSDRADITARDWDPQDFEIPDKRNVISAYSYEVSDGEGLADEFLTFRVLAEDERADSVAVLEDGALKLRSTRRDGSYLVFTAPASGSFVILEGAVNLPLVIGLGILGAAALAFVIIALGKKRRKNRREAESMSSKD